jgi:hypothetical protein
VVFFGFFLIWNDLSPTIRNLQTISQIKSKIKGEQFRPPVYYGEGSRKFSILQFSGGFKEGGGGGFGGSNSYIFKAETRGFFWFFFCNTATFAFNFLVKINDI